MGMHADDAMGATLDHGFWWPKAKSFTCKYCGKRGLKWGVEASVWRLREKDSSTHNCPQYKRPERAP